MALINCPECSKQVSSIAAACPDCGYPIHQAQISGRDVDPSTTIEQTSKKWKKYKLVAALLVIVGLIIASQGSGNSSPFGAFFFLAGIVVGIYACFGSWWHHS